MMLRALYELSRRQRLVEDPDYEKKPVDYLIRISDEGTFLSLEPTQNERGRGLDRTIPRIPKRAVNIAPGFFVDNAKYVLALGPEGKKKGELALKRQAFRDRVFECVAFAEDVGAKAVLLFLDSEVERAKAASQRSVADWTGSEMLAFAFGSECVHERAVVRDYWARQQRTSAEEGLVGRCLVTGDLTTTARLHPSIKHVPKAQSSGASLVSFNADAFVSHGLEQGSNATVSTIAAIGYTTALNWLLERTADRVYRYGISLGDESVALFWTSAGTQIADVFLALMAPTADQAVHFSEAPFRGLEPGELDEADFHCVTVGGNASRVVVRDWFETSIGDVKAHLRAYFADLRIGEREPAPIPIWRLLKCLQAPGRTALRPDMSASLVRAAFRGTALPRELLPLALRRLRVADPPEAPFLCALIKATLLRLPRSGLPQLEVSVTLNRENVHPPYLLGRLFAVLERLQGAALGDVNATIRDRYFGAASTTPAIAFPRLIRLSMHHASKAKNGGWFEKLKGEIIAALPPNDFPKILTLEEQGLFAIGYYHQREVFFTKRADAEDVSTTEEEPLQ